MTSAVEIDKMGSTWENWRAVLSRVSLTIDTKTFVGFSIFEWFYFLTEVWVIFWICLKSWELFRGCSGHTQQQTAGASAKTAPVPSDAGPKRRSEHVPTWPSSAKKTTPPHPARPSRQLQPASTQFHQCRSGQSAKLTSRWRTSTNPVEALPTKTRRPLEFRTDWISLKKGLLLLLSNKSAVLRLLRSRRNQLLSCSKT